MDTEAAVREAIREHNSDVMIRSVACAVIGTIGTLIAIILVLVLFSKAAFRSNAGLVEIGFICFLLFCSGALAAWLSKGGIRSASREIDDAMDTAHQSRVSWVLFPQMPAVALLAWGAFGPFAFVEAIMMLRERVSAREEIVRGSAEVLRLLASDQPLPLRSLAQPRAAGVLLQLALAKPCAGATPPAIIITEKGRDMVLGRWRRRP